MAAASAELCTLYHPDDHDLFPASPDVITFFQDILMDHVLTSYPPESHVAATTPTTDGSQGASDPVPGPQSSRLDNRHGNNPRVATAPLPDVPSGKTTCSSEELALLDTVFAAVQKVALARTQLPLDTAPVTSYCRVLTRNCVHDSIIDAHARFLSKFARRMRSHLEILTQLVGWDVIRQ